MQGLHWRIISVIFILFDVTGVNTRERESSLLGKEHLSDAVKPLYIEH